MVFSKKILLWYAFFVRKCGKMLVFSDKTIPKCSEQADSCLQISDILYSFPIAFVLLTVY